MEEQEKQKQNIAILNEIENIGFEDINDKIKKILNGHGLTDNYISNLIADTKKSFISDLRAKYNIHNISMDRQKESDLKELIDREDKLSTIEEKIKLYFSQYSKDSKIKQFIGNEGFNIAITNLLKSYSYSKIKDDYPIREDLFKLIQEKTDKYILFSKWNLKDTYSRNKDLRNLQTLLSLFNIKIEIANYSDSLKDYQDKINESQEVKVKLYLNGKIYLQIKDKAKHKEIRDYILNETLTNSRGY